MDVRQLQSPTPQALNLRNPMQAERSDAQLGVVTHPLTATPTGVEPVQTKKSIKTVESSIGCTTFAPHWFAISR
jgi:hypothetical protein